MTRPPTWNWAAVVITAITMTTPAIAAGRAVAPPRCQPGTLVSAAPYLPHEFVVLPDGGGLLLADRGALTLRDPVTLAVRRTLLPSINEWRHVYASPDGAVVEAQTFDGLRFRFDPKTWSPTRLPDDRAIVPKKALEDETLFQGAIATRGIAAIVENTKRFWKERRASLGLPELSGGAEATAFTMGIVRTRGGGEVLDPLDPIAPGDDVGRFRVVVADTAGKLWMFADGKQRATSAALAGAQVTGLDISGGRIVAALASGEIAVLAPDLGRVERRATVRPEPAAAATSPKSQMSTGEKAVPHGIRSAHYDPSHGRITWLSTARELGTFDLATGRETARITGTGAALLDAQFVDEGTVALLTNDGLSLWDATSGGAIAQRREPYLAMFRVGGGLLALGPEGSADLLDARTLTRQRRVCLLREGCATVEPSAPEGMDPADWKRLPPATRRQVVERMRTPRERAVHAAAKAVRAVLSPDGRMLATLQYPFEGDEGESQAARPGAITLWDARTLRVRRSVPLRSCYDGSIAFASSTALKVCGDQRLDVPNLQPFKGKSSNDDTGSKDPYRRDEIPVGSRVVRVWRAPKGHEIIDVVDPARNQDLQLLAAPEEKSGGETGAAPDIERHQLRAKTLVAAAPGGRRFLLAGRADNEGMMAAMGFYEARGGLQIWCAPDGQVTDDVPPEPPVPAVAVFDGITEIALPALPPIIIAAATVGERVFVLGTDAKREGRALVALSARGRAVETQPLPPGGPWERLRATPLGDGLWLEGPKAVSRRNRDGSWMTFPLATGDIPLAPFSADAAAHLARRPCTPAETALAKAEPNLRDYYAHNRAVFVIPQSIEGKVITVRAQPESKDEPAARTALATRAAALAQLLRAPGADFAAVHARAMKDRAIGASPDFALSVVDGQLTDERRPFARLFTGRAGEVVGPIETSYADPYGRWKTLSIHFVRLDKVTPESLRPFSYLTEQAVGGNWYPIGASGGDCADLTVVGLGRDLRRTILPPHASRSMVAWSGGFAVTDNPSVAYDHGAWLPAGSPVAAARAKEAKISADRAARPVQRNDAPPVPSWASPPPDRAAGPASTWWWTADVIMRRDGDASTAFFHPNTRRKAIADRRWNGQ